MSEPIIINIRPTADVAKDLLDRVLDRVRSGLDQRLHGQIEAIQQIADDLLAELRAAEERGRQQGWREAIEQAARNAEGHLGSVLLTPRQFAMWLRQYLTSVAPTEGTQTSAD